MGEGLGEKQEKVALTYETLFDILRVEKRRDELQELSESFLENVVTYLQQKKELLIKKQHESGIDSFDEVKKISIQFENIQKIVKEIYERREKKIILLALNNSRTKIMDVKNGFLLPHEEELYRQLTRLLGAYRLDVMEKALKGQVPKQELAAVLLNVQDTRREKEETQIESKLATEKQEINETQEVPSEMDQGQAALQTSSLIQVKFLEEIEEFVGPELETYGPFSSNTVAALPAAIAEIFLSTGSAEEVKED